MYKEELKKLILYGIIGFVIGFIFTSSTSPEMGFGGACVIGLFFAGLPYGWKISGYIIGGWIIVGNIAVMIIAFFIRVIVSLIIGWIAYPIAMIYYIIKVCKNLNSCF